MKQSRDRDDEYVLLADSEFEVGDEYPREERMRTDVAADLIDIDAYERGEIPMRITEYSDGRRVTYWNYVDAAAFDKFRILIERTPTGRGFAASMPELPGCMAEGATQEDALANLRCAVTTWFDTAIREARELPKPGAAYTVAA